MMGTFDPTASDFPSADTAPDALVTRAGVQVTEAQVTACRPVPGPPVPRFPLLYQRGNSVCCSHLSSDGEQGLVRGEPLNVTLLLTTVPSDVHADATAPPSSEDPTRNYSGLGKGGREAGRKKQSVRFP